MTNGDDKGALLSVQEKELDDARRFLLASIVDSSDDAIMGKPVVILTTSLEEQDIVAGYKLGANSYIRKPVDFTQLADVLKQMGLYWLVINQPPVAEGG